MTIREAQRAERQSMKNKSKKEKLAYWIDYNGVKALVVVFIAALLFTGIYQAVTRKDSALHGTYINAMTNKLSTAYLDGFAAVMNIDTKQYDLYADTSITMGGNSEFQATTYETTQLFAAQLTAREIDTIASGIAVFTSLAYQECLQDLRTVYTPEQLEQLSPHLFYLDGESVKAYIEANQTPEDDAIQVPDPRDPASMQNPIPVGVFLDGATTEFHDAFTFAGELPVMGIAVTSERQETAAAFILYTLDIQ